LFGDGGALRCGQRLISGDDGLRLLRRDILARAQQRSSYDREGDDAQCSQVHVSLQFVLPGKIAEAL
jgi:hypothetical protein